jgi:hypothetical protein
MQSQLHKSSFTLFLGDKERRVANSLEPIAAFAVNETQKV